jgi:DNA-binding NtrC family response regulator
MGRASTLTFRPGSRGLRVLFADGDPATRFRVAAAFDRDGHNVVSATSATQLLFALQTSADGLGATPDVVVVDITMDDGMAWQVLREYRAHLTESKVIILSKHNAKRMFDDLAPYVILKRPVDEELLREAVQDARAPQSYTLDVEDDLDDDETLVMHHRWSDALRLDRGGER